MSDRSLTNLQVPALDRSHRVHVAEVGAGDQFRLQICAHLLRLSRNFDLKYF